MLLALGRRVVAVHHALVPQRRVVLEIHRAGVQARRVELLVAQGGLVELAQLLVAQVEHLVRGKGRLRLRLGLRLGSGRLRACAGVGQAHRAELLDGRGLAGHRAPQRVLVQLRLPLGALLAAREALVRRPLLSPELLE